MMVATARDAAELLGKRLLDAAGERLAVAHLDGQGRVLSVTVREGCTDAVDLPLRDILLDGMLIGARGIVVAHNHPSGDSAPSQADAHVTRRLRELSEALGIRLYDHLIFAGSSCSSMRALGLL